MIRPGPILGTIFTCAVALFLVVPILIVMATSFSTTTAITLPTQGLSLQWYEEILKTGRWLPAIGTSLIVGLLAAAIAAIVSVLLALGVTRGRLLPARLISALTVAPLIIPLIVLGVGSYLLFARTGLIGTVLGLAIAHSIVGLPYAFVNVLAAIQSVPTNVEEAAAVHGANPFKTFFRVTLPLILPGAVVGALFAFISSWDEVVIALFLTDVNVKTLPVLMWSEIRYGLKPTISAIATVVTLLTAAVFVGASILSSRRRGNARRKNAG